MLPERFYLSGAEILVGDRSRRDAFASQPDSSQPWRERSPPKAAWSPSLSPAATRRGDSFRHSLPSLSPQSFHGAPSSSSGETSATFRPSDPDSNYGMAREFLLSRVPVPASNIHRIPTGDGTAIEAADSYQRTLREKVAQTNQITPPRLRPARPRHQRTYGVAVSAPPQPARAAAPGCRRPCR